ncbi:MAG: peptidylprolyl isomerase [Oscillospiraceae bacterium]|nr:peptidylprolyl isomerase [Oscillospiraceae bacterium]
MSGSKDKKRRQDQKGQGAFDLRNPKEMEADQTRKKQTRTAVIVILAVVVAGLLLTIVNSHTFYRTVPALRVDGTGVSIAEMNYYLHAVSQQAAGDPDIQLERAVEMATRSTVLYRQAVAAGLTLTPEWQAQIDAEIQRFQDTAEMWDVSVDAVLIHEFGDSSARSINLNVLRRLFETAALGHMYVEHAIEERRAGYSQAELEAFYQENRDDIEFIAFRVHAIPFTPEADIPELLETEGFEPEMVTALADARAAADAIAQAARDGEEGFVEGVLESMDEEMRAWFSEEETRHSAPRSQLDALAYGDWLLADQRSEGDVTVVVGDHDVFVVLFLSADDNRYYTANVRHILIRPEEVESIDFSDPDLDFEEIDWEAIAAEEEAAQAVAEAEAEAILARWRAGAATEESFIELVREYSDDYHEGAADPGMISDINRQSNLVPEFLSWSTDTARQVGDVGIVQTQFGFHIMYFVGYNDEIYHRYALAQQGLAARDFEEWLESALEAANPRTTFFSRFAGGP